MDKYNIDSHKLMYHPIEVSNWLRANSWDELKKIYPIYVEISPYGGCKHRCSFCALDYMGYANIAIDFEILKNTITQMAKNGVKSIMFAGEGEPLLFKNLDLITKHCTKVGTDSSLTTNFVPIRKNNVEMLMENCSWIKVSLNAGTKQTYANIHNTKEEDFDKVITNLQDAINHKRKKNLKCTLGVQTLLLPENKDEIKTLAKIVKNIGVDYLVIKPYSQHNFSKTNKYKNINYSKMLYLKEELEEFSDDSFDVIFRIKTTKKFIKKTHLYNKCYSTPFFWAYIASDGKVFGCSAYLGDDKFCYGNIYENSFSEIWEGNKRKISYEFIQNKLDISNCRLNCRMDNINEYLYRLKNPNEHDNFI